MEQFKKSINNLEIMKNPGLAHKMPDGSLFLTYKGLLELADRSGKFKEHFVTEVKIDDEVKGFLSYFKLISGEEQYLFMTVAEITDRVNKTNKSFNEGKGVWVDYFNIMASKMVHKMNLLNPKNKSHDIIMNELTTK
jgi:recombinational DNA repair protein RecT